MSTALVSYQFDETPVRVVMIADDPWFVANDVARILGYPRQQEMARLLDDDEKGVHLVHSLGGQQEMNIISESGLYHAAIKRRGKEAQRFRRWVTAEVLPALRKTGRYVLHEPPPATALAQEIPVARLNANLQIVREARKLWGPLQARQIWAQLGLPVAFAEATEEFFGDPMATPLRDWLAGRLACTAHEAAIGIGIEEPNHGDRNRVGRLLGLFGWHPKKVREGTETVSRWFAPEPMPWVGLGRGEAME